MPYIILFLLIFFVSFITICKAKANDKLRDKIFKLQDTYKRINCVQVLTKIIEKKLSKPIFINKTISKEKFNKLDLIVAPVYVINAKRVGDTHLKFFCRALENVRNPMNFVVIDGFVRVVNKNINVVCLNLKYLSYSDISLLNVLNINIKSNSKVSEKFCDNYINLNDNLEDESLSKRQNVIVPSSFQLDTFKSVFELDIGNYSFTLNKNPFGYLIKGKRNKSIVYDAFGDKVVEFSGQFIASFENNLIYIKTGKKSKLYVQVEYDSASCDYLQLLQFNLKYKDYDSKFLTIKEKALEQLAYNPFLPLKQIDALKYNTLTDFFKVVNLRKQYYNDYIYLLRNEFGLFLHNSILNAKPSNLIDDDFVISYNLGGKEFEVKYSACNDNKVKLSRVGHKLGVQENFVYDF